MDRPALLPDTGNRRWVPMVAPVGPTIRNLEDTVISSV